MKSEVASLLDECQALDALLGSLSVQDWALVTPFFDWTIADQIMHLHLVDDFGISALVEPHRFPEIVADVRDGQARGIELSQRMRKAFGTLSPASLREQWREGWRHICSLLEAADVETRVPWFGPPMSAQAFATARQMEVWAHGQDIYDRLGMRRLNDDRIRSICELGVRTHGWSFANHKLERPDRPEVSLIAPSGDVWTWNGGAQERIEGSAEDFALVVTQRRNVRDTALQVTGESAQLWMDIAQCFAGAAEQGPAPGERVVRYAEG